MKRQKYYYLAVTNDVFEFPLISAESYEELSNFLCRSKMFLKKAFERKAKDNLLNCRYIRVPIEEEGNKYQEKGFADRKDYLNWLAFKYEVSKETVNVFANMYGENEDFNKLIVMLENISKTK